MFPKPLRDFPATREQVHERDLAIVARKRAARWRWRAGVAATALCVLILALAWRGSYFDRDPYVETAATAPRSGVTALYFSGDMGLRFGLGTSTADALAAAGIPVIGFNAPAVFRTRRTPAGTVAIVADAVRHALSRASGDRLVLIGRSYGADILAAALPALPTPLRARIAGVVLLVPARDIFYRADATNITYLGTPDDDGHRALRAMRWAPLTCIYGTDETDSACPGLVQPNVTLVAMPGGHFLGHDTAAIVRNVISAIGRMTRITARPMP